MPASDYTFSSVMYNNAGPGNIWDDLAEMNITRITHGVAETLTVYFYGVPVFYTSGAAFMIPDTREVPAGVVRPFRSRWGADPGWGMGAHIMPCAIVSHTGWAALVFGPVTVLA